MPSSSLSVVAGRFPHVREHAEHLFERDETFREICEEYEACNVTIRRLGHKPCPEGLRSEYAALQLRLEGELLRYLEEHPDA